MADEEHHQAEGQAGLSDEGEDHVDDDNNGHQQEEEEVVSEGEPTGPGRDDPYTQGQADSEGEDNTGGQVDDDNNGHQQEEEEVVSKGEPTGPGRDPYTQGQADSEGEDNTGGQVDGPTAAQQERTLRHTKNQLYEISPSERARLNALIEQIMEIAPQLKDYIPYVVVVGSQSSGKSSFVQYTIGFPMNVVKKGTATIRPLFVTCIKDATSELIVQIKEDKDAQFTTIEAGQLYSKIAELNDPSTKLHGEPIYLKIKGKSVPNLCFVDLPGITEANPEKNRSVAALLRRETKHPNRHILYLLSGGHEIENDGAFKYVKKVPDWREKLIGAITKLDDPMTSQASFTGTEMVGSFNDFQKFAGVMPFGITVQSKIGDKAVSDFISASDRYSMQQKLIDGTPAYEREVYQKYFERYPDCQPSLQDLLGVDKPITAMEQLQLKRWFSLMPTIMRSIEDGHHTAENQLQRLKRQIMWSDPKEVKPATIKIAYDIIDRMQQLVDGNIVDAKAFTLKQEYECAAVFGKSALRLVKPVKLVGDRTETTWKEDEAFFDRALTIASEVANHDQPLLGGSQFIRSTDAFSTNVVDMLTRVGKDLKYRDLLNILGVQPHALLPGFDAGIQKLVAYLGSQILPLAVRCTGYHSGALHSQWYSGAVSCVQKIYDVPSSVFTGIGVWHSQCLHEHIEVHNTNLVRSVLQLYNNLHLSLHDQPQAGQGGIEVALRGPLPEVVKEAIAKFKKTVLGRLHKNQTSTLFNVEKPMIANPENCSVVLQKAFEYMEDTLPIFIKIVQLQIKNSLLEGMFKDLKGKFSEYLESFGDPVKGFGQETLDKEAISRIERECNKSKTALQACREFIGLHETIIERNKVEGASERL